MDQLATITSKRQLTIPSLIFRHLNLHSGQKVHVSTDNNSIIIKPAISLVENLAGSVSLPPKYKGLSLDQTIKKTKQDYFKKP